MTRKETKKTKVIHQRITEKLYKALKAKDVNISETVRKALEKAIEEK